MRNLCEASVAVQDRIRSMKARATGCATHWSGSRPGVARVLGCCRAGARGGADRRAAEAGVARGGAERPGGSGTGGGGATQRGLAAVAVARAMLTAWLFERTPQHPNSAVLHVRLAQCREEVLARLDQRVVGDHHAQPQGLGVVPLRGHRRWPCGAGTALPVCRRESKALSAQLARVHVPCSRAPPRGTQTPTWTSSTGTHPRVGCTRRAGP